MSSKKPKTVVTNRLKKEDMSSKKPEAVITNRLKMDDVFSISDLRKSALHGRLSQSMPDLGEYRAKVITGNHLTRVRSDSAKIGFAKRLVEKRSSWKPVSSPLKPLKPDEN